MILGLFKNIEDLESTLNLSELELIVTTARDQQHANQRFFAALKGINLDDPDGGTNNTEDDGRERLEILQARADAINAGRDPDEAEFEFYGIDIETE